MAHGTRNGTPYRSLILDFAGVLTVDVHPAHRAWCASEGLDPQAWVDTLETNPEGRRLYVALESGEIDQREWNRRTAALLGVDDENLMGRAWTGVAPAAEMVQLARDARAAGLLVALLSNSFGLDPYNPYEALGVWDLFDVHVISEVEGIAKPDPAIYERTLDRLGLPGEACVFVDDHERNLPPAAALGITTVHADGQDGTAARVAALLGLCTAPAA
ncbi:HAD-IA family hydrolase [Streptomyces sp. RB6PN25]|uniref:HAD-IA family hydrolase n=1 Tax=Streptomyces humicola TaxID=2953240 RepID=A0ABT1Q370_9ACTN|nr:HAD-IA family hydrolase [Streptomyces humicola]MCQ4084372.1 HAD-IA family hydrolase [Streptomyces humicola]